MALIVQRIRDIVKMAKQTIVMDMSLTILHFLGLKTLTEIK
jgi:hypothetical protein